LTIASPAPEAIFLPHILHRRARTPGDSWSFTFLDSQGAERCRWQAAQLAGRARAVAGHLAGSTRRGEPVLLVFQPGADFLAAFMGCLWSGRLATPINPPRRNRLVERLAAVAADSGARVALTSADLLESTREWRRESEQLGSLQWVATDSLEDNPAMAPEAVGAQDVAFLQYTSGSTALPKGVQVTHGNLVEDLARMQAAWALSPGATMVSWLPAFHDLGLIFGLLQPLYSGCASVQMAPNAFLQNPALWLGAVSRYRGTHSAAPSFAYDLCSRRIAPQDRAGLDLGSLVMTMNAAEPINPAVMDRFTNDFQPYGFRREAFAPAYGLAESTLAVTANPVGEAPVLRRFDAQALGAGGVSLLDDGSAEGRLMPGSGRPLPDVSIAIVDPDTLRRCAPGRIGEIWVGGPTIADGYWRRPEETAATFGVRIAGEAHAGPFLRTGDLGALVDGELFVTGRIKDLIILGGANFYPHDIERAAQNAHDALRRDNGAAFSIDAEPGGDGREQVVLVQELERSRRNDDPAPVFQAIVQAVWQDMEVALSRVVLVAPGSVLRTSSGKIQRLANRRAYLDGKLPVIAQWDRRAALRPAPAAAKPDEAAALAAWLTGWLARRLDAPLAAIEASHGFAEMGLDSLGSAELAAELGRRIGVELPDTIAFDHPTLARLLRHVAALRAAAPGSAVCASTAASAVSGAAAATPSAAGSDLDDLLSAIERGDG